MMLNSWLYRLQRLIQINCFYKKNTNFLLILRAGLVCRYVIYEIEAIQLGIELGYLRISEPFPVRTDWNKMSCKQLDAELRARKVKGRSKARRKAQKIAILTGLEG